jgi:ABC-type sugar transport system ATPase subunit
MTTSDVEEACAVCDRVLVMRSGRIGAVLEGDSQTPERVAAVLLGSDEADPARRNHAS